MELPHPKVVITEDDTDLLEALVRGFREAGFDVFAAKNGVEGVSRVSQARPQLIVLDLLMPQMNGHEMMQELITHHEWVKEVPVLVTTNYSATDSGSQAWMKEVQMAYVLKSDMGLAALVEQAKKLLQPNSQEVY